MPHDVPSVMRHAICLLLEAYISIILYNRKNFKCFLLNMKKREAIELWPIFLIVPHHVLVALYANDIDFPAPRIAVWHHEACRVMANGDPKGRIFLSYPHPKNGHATHFQFVFIQITWKTQPVMMNRRQIENAPSYSFRYI